MASTSAYSILWIADSFGSEPILRTRSSCAGWVVRGVEVGWAVRGVEVGWAVRGVEVGWVVRGVEVGWAVRGVEVGWVVRQQQRQQR